MTKFNFKSYIPVVIEVTNYLLFYLAVTCLVAIVFYISSFLSQYTALNLQMLILFSLIALVNIRQGIQAGIFTGLLLSVLNYIYSPQPATYTESDMVVQSLFFLFFALLMAFLKNNYIQSLIRVKKSENHFRALAEHSVYPIILKDPKRRLLFVGKSFKRLLGFKPEEVVGKELVEFVHSEDRESFDRFNNWLINNPGKIKSSEFRFLHKKGEWVWLNNTAVNLMHEPTIKSIVSSFQDITLQKELYKKMEEALNREKIARKLAEDAVKERDEFLAIASHELKTPLTTLILQIQSTLRRILTQSLADFSGEKLVNSLTTAQDQSKRLAKMIKDLLSVSLVSTGKLDIDLKETEIVSLVEEVVNRYRLQVKDGGVKINYTHPDITIVGMWDSIRLEQVLLNLLSNAEKYGQGKNIDVGLEYDQKNNKVNIKVKDYGSGISKEDQKKLFLRFSRGNNHRQSGLGIGLFIVKQIVQAMHGEVSLESDQNKGTLFTVSLPIIRSENKT